MSQGRAIVSDTRFTTVNGTSSNVAAPSATGGGRLCIAADACFAAHREVTRPVPLAAPAALPDGRLLFVEGARDVRILAGGTLLDEPALARVDDRLRIIALFVDPSFGTTRFVRVAWIDESAQRRLIAAYARSGRRAEALAQYRAFRRILVDALGVEPSQETAAVHALVLAGEPL
jgi:hypothetical protein